jgi:hypothetical protein
MNSEFHDSNLHDDVDGVWALGRDVRLSLPGVFWLNFFGPAYAQLIGKERMLSVPDTKARTQNGNVILELYANPEDWSTSAGQGLHRSTIARLGGQFFFDKLRPERPTHATDFGLAPLPERPSPKVMTTDGKHFTVLDN